MKIGIISLGLIGGSLLKALSETDNTIYTVTRNKETVEKAKKYTKNSSDNIESLKDCEIIFVASPINKTLDILDKLENIVSRNCIVLDCASVKEFVMNKKRPYKFIGSHPMAGTEFNGFDASFKELFIGAKWVLTPSENVNTYDINLAGNIITQTGANIVITTAKEHDDAVALISHMPLIVSQALFYSARNNTLALKLASSGFRDMTRLAISNLEMAQDMKLYNASNINNAIEKLISSINLLTKTKDIKILSDIKNIRTKMYSSEGKNIL
ncbi:TPA: prephenate dehydrogenase/arogenate dehydrogenase family protein [Candidatus Avigastranaerophilus faecigallinarum]|nr:prephenate dehydrogenase/arogenate dehydrogenase family protein [Candidatus Avigastranaerophilus faecigallinarum]